jgi:hypothetical protein
MENRAFKSFGVVTLFLLSILSVSSTDTTDTILPLSHKNAAFSVVKKMPSSHNISRDETELKYYTQDNLDQVIGACGNATWQEAIRLTQDEMAAYKNWTLTKVNVAYNADYGCPFIDVRIYIYDEGTQTHPGNLLVSDTACRLNRTDVHTIPLLTPVNLSGFNELWVAVEWTEASIHPYAWIDTLSGPHVPDKSDFVKLGSTWTQLHIALPEVDGRWGIGAIIEGQGATELTIGTIRGPLGLQAEVQNIGGNNANNLHWSCTVSGRGLHRTINITERGTTATLNIGASLPIDIKVFFGFAWIQIEFSAYAQNANQVQEKKTALLLGPFVLKIRDLAS